MISSLKSRLPSLRMSTSLPAKMRKPSSAYSVVQRLDLLDLGQQAFFIEAVGLEGRFAVVGDAEVLQAEIVRGFGHLPQGAAAVAGGGVVVEDAAEVFELHEAREAAVLGRVDLAGVLTQFGSMKSRSERAVHVGLIVNRRADRRIRA
jgi:hypothetical protein